MGIVYSGVVDAPRPDVFAWHERRGAIERLLPPRQPIKVVSEAASLADGGGVLALPGGLRWTAQHQPAAYDPSAFFANALASDVLRSVPAGLIGSWRHEHCFGVVDAASSRVTGRVGTPAGYGGRSAADVSMTASTARRRTCQSSVVTRARPPAGHRCGDRSIGLIGTALAAFSSTGGYRVIRLVSRQPQEGAEYRWDRDPPDARHRCVDAVVHQNVVVGWEAATAPATAAAPRVVSVRTLVQTPRGATLRSLRPRFAAGLGGRLGSGRHWLSWIDIVDLIEVCRSTLGDPALSGPVNAVAGSPFRNPRYSRWPARILHRPALLALAGPGMGPTLLLGERWAQGLATASQRVVPCQLIEAGNRFRRAVLELCLPHELGHLVEETP